MRVSCFRIIQSSIRLSYIFVYCIGFCTPQVPGLPAVEGHHEHALPAAESGRGNSGNAVGQLLAAPCETPARVEEVAAGGEEHQGQLAGVGAPGAQRSSFDKPHVPQETRWRPWQARRESDPQERRSNAVVVALFKLFYA